MRVFENRDASRRLRSFEVENFWLSRKRAARVVLAIPGVRVLRAESKWWGRDDFCEFELNGVRLAIEEPFGDNSRYVVFADGEGHEAEIAVARQAFLDLRRPEWISSPLVYAVILLASAFAVLRRCPGETWWWTSVASIAFLGAAVLMVWWAVALRRGRYRSEPVDESSLLRDRAG